MEPSGTPPTYLRYEAILVVEVLTVPVIVLMAARDVMPPTLPPVVDPPVVLAAAVGEEGGEEGVPLSVRTLKDLPLISPASPARKDCPRGLQQGRQQRKAITASRQRAAAAVTWSGPVHGRRARPVAFIPLPHLLSPPPPSPPPSPPAANETPPVSAAASDAASGDDTPKIALLRR